MSEMVSRPFSWLHSDGRCAVRTACDQWFKLRVNSERDRRTDEILRLRGWTVLRFWEHDEPSYVAATIRKHLMQQAVLGGAPT